MILEFNKKYRHKGNGKDYKIHEKVLIKQENGDWLKGCLYRPVDDDGSTASYIRTDKNFIERFVPIENVEGVGE